MNKLLLASTFLGAAFTDNFIGRADYRYTDFEDFDFNVDRGSGSTDLATNDAYLGIAYKF